ncbi:AAC(3) family N-acetyltransferase [Deinococcus peraridilitoris]|uniref:Aminoglycoside N(3)-acetyltransferase n=1 Tax=Deinococcus peraridilitoris (strain DSM 19664 / LMG 22246 / CIP 109416 / KR-200) TaxID=937777 RepID=K9ZWE4_DEIPD|nr:AAC(3) family N-acetyltransferase [Deinococcus peraridilitoris]AFZ65901.1 aminoglycoside N3'-acetyltransferase [Deinococcus peraridilitoris DSM 19664]
MLNFMRRPAVTEEELSQALAEVGLDGTQHIIAHASLRAFGFLEGGAPTMLRALRARSATLVMPSFSYYTLVWPEEQRQPDWAKPAPPPGPAYGRFSRVSSDIGRVPQTLADDATTLRSFHPALSFVALGERAEEVLDAQSLESPYGPIGKLYDLDGVAVLLGVDHRSNTTIHYGEYWAGVPLLDRYVVVNGEVRRTSFPNCSADFGRIAPHVRGESVTLGRGRITAFRVRELVDGARRLLAHDPEALLCSFPGCRCQAVRQRVRRDGLMPRPHLGAVRAP